MKIHFSNFNPSSQSGPNSFGYRLAEEFVNLGHEIILDPGKHYDTFLAFIEPASRPRKKAKTILRLDGIWFKPDEYHNNRSIESAYKSFDVVVWQSEFDKKMTHKWFGKRDGYVISNGIRKKTYPPRQLPSSFEGYPNTHKYFACSSSWHGQKRLPDNIRLFKKIRAQLWDQGIDSTLIVMGDVPSDVSAEVNKVWYMGPERIAFTGKLPHEECLRIYAECDYFLHLAWLDHCPNVVVEAMSQGCPVICTDSGGTHEIVKDSGIIIPETTPYNFDLLDYDKPYELDLEGFVLPEDRVRVNSNHLDIEMIARRYLGAMT